MSVKRGTFGQCRSSKTLQNLSISHCIVTLKPARSKPRSMPPIPEKNDASVGT